MRSALVIGRANGVWDEVHEARTTYAFDTIIAINTAGCHYDGHLEHWVSYHAELFPNWMALREQRGYPPAKNLWTSSRGRHMGAWEKANNVHFINSEGGSSGMIAVRVAFSIGCDRVILAGIPLDNERGHFDQPGAWDEAQYHRVMWVQLKDHLYGRVKSMSGWTREVFGAPTLEWFNGYELRGSADPVEA